MVAWIKEYRGKTIAYVVVTLSLLALPALYLLGVAGRGPVPTERPAVCSRTLC
ncbi:MAG: hypothetical protein ACRYG8_06620 [Janthinobacterium lividum]